MDKINNADNFRMRAEQWNRSSDANHWQVYKFELSPAFFYSILYPIHVFQNAGNFCLLTTHTNAHFDSRMFSNAWEGMKERGGYICERDDEKKGLLEQKRDLPRGDLFFLSLEGWVYLSMCADRDGEPTHMRSKPSTTCSTDFAKCWHFYYKRQIWRAVVE